MFLMERLYYAYALLFFGLAILGGAIVYYDKKKCEKEGKIEEDKFYFGTFSRRKMVEQRKVTADTWLSWIEYLDLVMAFYVLGVMLANIPGLREIWRGTGEHVDTFPETMYTMWIALFGILVVFSTFSKRHWLTFAANDIMRHFGIEKKMEDMLLMIVSVGILDFVSTMVDSEKNYAWFFGLRFLIFIFFLYHMFLFCRISIVLIRAFFGNKMESIFLNKLYTELWYRPIKVIEGKWNESTVQTYVEFLCDSFCCYAKRVTLKNVDEIKYSSNIWSKGEGDQKQRFDYLRKKCAIFFSVMLLFVLILVPLRKLIGNEVNWRSFLWEMVVIMGLAIGFYFIIIKFQNIARFCIILVFGRCAYEIKFNGNKKRYVREVPLFEWRLYFRYIHSIKNMVTFCYLAMLSENYEVVDKMLERCEEERRRMPDIVLPMMVIDYVCRTLYKKGENQSFKFRVQEDDNYIKFAEPIVMDVERSITWRRVKKDAYSKYVKKGLRRICRKRQKMWQLSGKVLENLKANRGVHS